MVVVMVVAEEEDKQDEHEHEHERQHEQPHEHQQHHRDCPTRRSSARARPPPGRPTCSPTTPPRPTPRAPALTADAHGDSSAAFSSVTLTKGGPGCSRYSKQQRQWGVGPSQDPRPQIADPRILVCAATCIYMHNL